MSSYWADRDTSAANLHLLEQSGIWKQWDDEAPPMGGGGTGRAGCHKQVTETLQNALHSSNVVILLGSGASFSARNHFGPNAPGMKDLWIGVQVGSEARQPGYFANLVNEFFGSEAAAQKEGIEKLLSLCKMRLELLSERRRGLHDTSGSLPQTVDLTKATAEINKLAAFVGDAEAAILNLVSFVNSATTMHAHEELLAKFARRSPEKPRVRIFTTNYDLCIEEAALRINAVLIDGFSHSARQRYNRDNFDHDIVRRKQTTPKAEFIDGVFHLYKLHGSVDWRRLGDLVFRSEDMDFSKGAPVLIYPRSTKYQEAFDAPYLDMFAALQSALREPDTTLIISGFGFSDDHISGPIWAALQSNLSLNLIVCDLAFIPDRDLQGSASSPRLDLTGRNPHQARIMQLVLHGDRRVTVLNGRFDDLTSAIPQMEGKTDRQRLEALLAQVSEALAR